MRGWRGPRRAGGLHGMGIPSVSKRNFWKIFSGRANSMTDCVLCHREIKGNVNPQKIITCGRCVQILLTTTRENKITYREKLASEGKMEEAMAVQSFIIPEVNGHIATPKMIAHFRHSKGVQRGVKAHSRYVSDTISGG